MLFPLIIANTDDFGRMPGDAFTIKNVVLPSSRRPERDFDQALDVLAETGLIERYTAEAAIYLQVNKFDEHQPNLAKRTKSKFPEFPGSSGNFRRNITESKRTEFKRTESNLTENPELRRDRRVADSLFDRFWAAYPKKKAKDDALRAWDKRRPDEALLQVILEAIARQKQTEDWQRSGGQFVPFPATWLNGARWTDTVDVDVEQLSDTARYNLAASDEAERLILDSDARRTAHHGHRR